MNNEDTSGISDHRPTSNDSHKNRLNRTKSAKFDEETPVVYIPPSKTLKYDPFVEEKRKHAVDEFMNKKFTYLAALLIGILLIILGGVFVWIGSKFQLKDFYIIGPGTLIIGIAITAVGAFITVRGIYKTKHANLTVVHGNFPSSGSKPAAFDSESFVTTSEVTMHL